MLERLSDVQTRDLDLDALREERAQTPTELIDTRRHKDSLQAALNVKEEQYREVRRQVNESELELKTLEARRKSAADAAIAAGSGKEAAQYQNQEIQFATRVQELEEDTFPLIERMETLEADVTRLQGEIDELEPVLAGLAAEEEVRVATIDERIGALGAEREVLARNIDAPLLKQYEQVRRSRRGLGLVPVVDGRRCGGCNVQLPLHVLQKVGGPSITRCPSCGRILWKEPSKV